MCNKCGKPTCSSCDEGQSLAQLQNTVAALQDSLATLSEAAKFLLCGHPILLIENADDVNSFDLETGIGSNCWKGWAICDGKTQKTSKNKNFVTPNFTDRFVVQAGGSYDVDDTGGAATVTLDITKIPAHTHAVTDPGHTHTATDAGHDHAVTDPGHNHNQAAHTHTYPDSTNDLGTAHFAYSDSGAALGGHDVTRTTNATTATNVANYTFIDINIGIADIDVSTNTTGITVANAGGGEAHENLPPYYAAFYVIKLG